MEEKIKNKNKNKNSYKKQKLDSKPESGFSFKCATEVKGLRFGGQFMVKSFTVRRSRPLELPRLLSLPLEATKPLLFPSTTAYVPTNFTILAHRAWHTLTLGLGTKKSKVVVFVFETESMKASAEKFWPGEVALGDVNKRLIRGMVGCEMARFKFRKGCITFYVYAVRRTGTMGFTRGEDLRTILQSVVDLKDFVDHTAMLAMPEQRSISCAHASSHSHLTMAH